MEEEKKYRRLAAAVILQWMEDYIEAKKREIKRGYLNEEHLITLKWTDTEWCDFWCEVAGVRKEKLLQWKERVDKKIVNQYLKYMKTIYEKGGLPWRRS